MGISVENYNEQNELDEYAKEALEREKPTWPMITVLHEACNGCVKQNFMVTNACQGCFARPCMVNCPKKPFMLFIMRILMLKNVFTAVYVNKIVLIMRLLRLQCHARLLVLLVQSQKAKMVMKLLIFISVFIAENV